MELTGGMNVVDTLLERSLIFLNCTAPLHPQGEWAVEDEENFDHLVEICCL